MPRSPRQVRKDVQEAVTEHVRDLPINAVRLAMFGVGRALLLSDRLTKDYKEIKESGVRPVLGRWRDDAEQTAVKVVDRVVERVTGAQEVPEAEIPVARPPRKVNNSLAADPEIAVGKPPPSPGNVTKIAPDPVPEPEPVVIAIVEPPLETVPEPEPGPAVPKPATEAAPAAAKPPSKPPSKPTAKPAPKPAAKAAPKPPAVKPTAKSAGLSPEPAPKRAAKRAAKAPAKPKTAAVAPEPVAADALPLPGYDGLTLASVRARLRGLNIEQVSLLRDYEQANAARTDFLRMYGNRIAKLKEGA